MSSENVKMNKVCFWRFGMFNDCQAYVWLNKWTEINTNDDDSGSILNNAYEIDISI